MRGFLALFAALITSMGALAQSSLPTVVHHSAVGNKVYLEIDARALQQTLDTIALAISQENNSWAAVLSNGSNPSMDVNFFGYDALGLGQVTTTGTFTGDSLVLAKDATIAGRLSVTGVSALSDSLTVAGFVSLGDSLEVVRAVSIGETLYVTSVTSLGDSLHVAGNVNMAQLLNVVGAATFESTVEVSGETTLNDTLHVNAVTLLNDSLYVGSSAHVAETLFADSISVTDVINGQIGSLSNHNTDNLSEGNSNLYFTTDRARASISAGTGVTISDGTVSIGQAVGTTDDVAFNDVFADSIRATTHMNVLGKLSVSDSAVFAGSLRSNNLSHPTSIEVTVPNIGVTYSPQLSMSDSAGLSRIGTYADLHFEYASERMRFMLDGDNYLDMRENDAGLNFKWISNPGLQPDFDLVDLKGNSGMTLRVGTGQMDAGIEMTNQNDLMVIYADTLFQPISEAMMIQIDSDEATDFHPVFGGQDHLYMTDDLNGNAGLFQHLTTYDELFGAGNAVSLFGSNDVVITADYDAGIEMSDHFNTAVIYGDSLTLKGDTRVEDDLLVDGSVHIAGDLVVNSVDLLAVIADLTERINNLENPNTCGIEVFDYNGNSYGTVQIGEQCWFTENLRATHYSNGDPINYVTDDNSWLNANSEAYCYYDNDPSYGLDYGPLYNWYAATDARGLCPSGWHVPSSAEITALYTEMGTSSGANPSVGLALKASATDTPPWDGENSSGFTAVPAGYRSSFMSVYFSGHGTNNYIWTSTEGLSYEGYLARIQSNNYCNLTAFFKQTGGSVRCVQD